MTQDTGPLLTRFANIIVRVSRAGAGAGCEAQCEAEFKSE